MKNEQGASLVEVLMSMVLLGVVSTGLLPGMLMNFKTVTRNELRSEATAAAQQVLDNLRTQDPTVLPTTGYTTDTLTVNGRDFTATTSYCLTSSICASNRSRHLAVEVQYKGEEIYEVETVFTQLR